ncbi:galactose-binding domain-like protein, partial [Baffinella frigidus]
TTHNCDPSANCTDTLGSFTCACLAGYADTGSGLAVDDGAGGAGDCTNINECALATHNCDPSANCTDTAGSFTCACLPGYTDTGSGLAVDDGVGGAADCSNINECELPTHSCDPSANCTDTLGSFTCACLPGYNDTGSGLAVDDGAGGAGDCSNINECALNAHDCDANAACSDTAGAEVIGGVRVRWLESHELALTELNPFSDQPQWLAMDTGSVQKLQGVATQGRGDGTQWVSSYTVSVSNDETTWVAVDGGFTFTGNTGGGDTVVRNNFTGVVTARHVRIEPGRGDGEPQWVSSYTVSVSNDSISWEAVNGTGPNGTIASTFTGNTGAGDTVVRNDFAAAVSARYVGVEPVTWNDHISMRAGVYIGAVPTYGLETFSPPEVTFSSIFDANAILSKISVAVQAGTAWIALSQDTLQWLAMDTGSLQQIEGVATQGRGGDTEAQWVSSYTVSVSNDGVAWAAVDGGFTFTGNTVNGDAVVRNNFAAVVTARHVRIEPVTWSNFISMRAGVYVARVATHNCDPFANCTDTAGSFTCACRPGYTDTGSGLAVDDGFGGAGDCSNTTI